jgi:hypothetical protein
LGIGRSNGGPVQLFAQGQGPPRSWTLSSHLVNNSGQQQSEAQISAFLHQHCPNIGTAIAAPPPPGPGVAPVAGPTPGRACLDQVTQSFHLLVSYQPAGRYWTFQWIETGIFAGLAVLAAIGCYWWVTRRSA